MSRSLRRGALAAALALSLAPLTACAAGDDAQTLGVRPDNAETSVGHIKIQNAVVLTTENRESGPAAVSARIFNNSDTAETIESVTVSDGSVTAKLADPKGGSKVVVPAHGTVLLGGEGNPSATIASGDEALLDGDYQKVVFDFSDTGEVAIEASVLPAEGYFAGYGPAETASASPSASPSGTVEPTGTATGSVTATAIESTTAEAADASR